MLLIIHPAGGKGNFLGGFLTGHISFHNETTEEVILNSKNKGVSVIHEWDTNKINQAGKGEFLLIDARKHVREVSWNFAYKNYKTIKKITFSETIQNLYLHLVENLDRMKSYCYNLSNCSLVPYDQIGDIDYLINLYKLINKKLPSERLIEVVNIYRSRQKPITDKINYSDPVSLTYKLFEYEILENNKEENRNFNIDELTVENAQNLMESYFINKE